MRRDAYNGPVIDMPSISNDGLLLALAAWSETAPMYDERVYDDTASNAIFEEMTTCISRLPPRLFRQLQSAEKECHDANPYFAPGYFDPGDLRSWIKQLRSQEAQ